MKKLFDRLDPKYVKIASYASITVLITVFAGYLIFRCLPILAKISIPFNAVMTPVVIGLVLWYLLLPLVSWIQKQLGKVLPGKKWLRALAVLLAFVLIILVIVIFLGMVSQAFVSSINLSSITNLIQGTQTDLNELAVKITGYLAQFNIVLPNIPQIATAFVTSIASGTTTLFFGVIFSIYFLLDWDTISSYWKRVIHILFSQKAIDKAEELMQDADKCFSGYIRGQCMDALLVGAVISVIFSFIKMDYALVIGLMAGIGNLIPYVGPALGYSAVVIINLMSGNFRMMIIGLIILEVVMTIDGNIINPRLLAGTIKIHPLLVIASLLAGGAIGGLLGMLLAVPIGAFLKLQFEKMLKARELQKASEQTES